MQGKYVWVSLAILGTWVAVGISAASGGEFETGEAGRTTEVPIAWGVAFFATIASAVMAFLGYRSSN